MAEALKNSSSELDGAKDNSQIPKVSTERIINAIKKMLDEIRALPLNSPNFEAIKSNVILANNIIEKTDTNGSLAIVNRFYNYYTSNKNAFLDRSQELIQPDLPLTKKIFISIGPVIKNTGGNTSEMWQHLTLIFYLISLYKNQPDQKLKQMLKENLEEKKDFDIISKQKDSDEEDNDEKDVVPSPTSSAAGSVVTDTKETKEATRETLRKKLRRRRRGGEEEDVIADVVKTVSSGIKGPINDPLDALGSLMSSGGLTKIMNTLQGAMASGRVKPKRMLSQVHSMLNDLTEQLPDDDKNIHPQNDKDDE